MANIYEYYLTLDMSGRDSGQMIPAMQLDKNSRKALITLTDRGLTFIPAQSSTVEFHCKKPSGKVCLEPAQLNDDGTVVVTLTEQDLAEPGEVRANICLKDGDSTLSSSSFWIRVAESGGNGTNIASKNELMTLTEAIDRANKVADDLEEALEEGDFTGDTGATFTPSVSAEGDLSWTNDRGLDNPDTVNIKGTAPHIGENGNWFIGETDTGTPAVETTYKEAEGSLIHIENPYAAPYLSELTIYGQSTQDGTPSPDNPVEIVSKGDSEELTVTAAGKNLLPYPYAHTTKTVNGLTFTDNGDGSITVNGTATANTNFICGAKLALIKGVYTFSDKFGESNYLYVDAFLDGVWVKSCRTTFESDGRYTYNLFVRILEGEVCDNLTIAPMLELGSTPTAYEPYRATTATLTNASHPDTPIFPLCGIPVDSGGNVTIDGQQYIADTLTKFADGTGECVKKTAIIDSYGGETIDTAYMSTTGELSTGATVLYALETPITIPLTAEEVAALEALQTYKPVSNVYNDAGAYMSTVCSVVPRGPKGEPGGVNSVNGKSGNITLTASDVGALSTEGGAMTGAINMQGQAISGLNDPTGDTDAARKGYVDTEVKKVDDNLKTYVRPNLLDNWYFVNPVNQRGQTSYIGNYTYCIDRWILQYVTTLDIQDNGVKLSGKWDIRQKIEGLVPYGTYTFTIKVEEPSAYPGKICICTYDDTSSVTQATTVIPAESTGLFSVSYTTWNTKIAVAINNDGNADGSLVISAAKLELGDTQTLAHQNADGNWVLNEIPNYGEELAKCQRYLLRVTLAAVPIFFHSKNVGIFTVPCHKMRTTPSIVNLSFDTFYLSDGTTLSSMNGYAVQRESGIGVQVYCSIDNSILGAGEILNLTMDLDANL